VPRYDYRCSACGHVYEKREGFDAPSVQECPECQGQARRILTPPAIVFKGSGWYVTDSRKSSVGTERDSGTSSDASEKKSETKSETKTESKSAPKSESTTAAPAAAD
jgi:putative FmdB family regulatory protein